MRRLFIPVMVLLFVSLACNISLPDISLPTVDLSQFSLSNQQKVNGSGNVVEEKRVINNYTQVTLSGVGDLFMEQGDSEGITIKAEDNLIQYIRVEVNNGKLLIGVQPGVNINPIKPIEYHLKIKTIEGLNLTGSGSIETPGLIGRTVTVNLAGSGHIKILKADANTINTHLNGSGDVTVGGRIQSQDITIDGAGNYHAENLESSSVKINIPGSGSGFVRALDKLDVSISGSGSVHYKGDPEINQNINGAGQVIQDK
jgi:hypothetical protein